MSTNLLDSISSVLSPDLVSNAASALGESPVATGKAVGATIPVILGGLVRGTGDGNLMSQILNMLKSPANDGTVLRNLRSCSTPFPAAPAAFPTWVPRS
jgi:Rad3-related DNA helicase